MKIKNGFARLTDILSIDILLMISFGAGDQ
jgi:hypothetical protein